jgi:hypothetical protein
MHMKITLQEIHARIKATILPRDFATVVLLELLPLLKEQGPLKTAYDARVHYYERLAKDEQYLVLIKTIHAAMKDIHRSIDPSKFPKEGRPTLFHPSTIRIVNAAEMHALLVQKDPWLYLGGKTVKGFSDSVLCPWRAVLGQYLKAIAWIQYATEVGAADEGVVRQNLKNLRISYNKLKQMLADPFKRLHITDFEHFYVSTRDPEKLLENESPKDFIELRSAAICICQDLLSMLDASEAQERSVADSKPHTARITQRVLMEWTGDQPISYHDGMLKIGTLTPAKIPAEDDAEKRRVLLTWLVRMYQEKKDGMGVTEALFQRNLLDIGIPCGKGVLRTAQLAINEEIEREFGLRNFVRVRSGSAHIVKKHKEVASRST